MEGKLRGMNITVAQKNGKGGWNKEKGGNVTGKARGSEAEGGGIEEGRKDGRKRK